MLLFLEPKPGSVLDKPGTKWCFLKILAFWETSDDLKKLKFRGRLLKSVMGVYNWWHIKLNLTHYTFMCQVSDVCFM